jgi:hypothetical protein
MYEAIRWTTPYVVLDAPVIRSAIARMQEFPAALDFDPPPPPEEKVEAPKEKKKAKPPEPVKSRARALHDSIITPLHAELAAGTQPELLLAWESDAKKEVHIIKIGERLFPIVSQDQGYGKRSIHLRPPRPANEVDVDALRRDPNLKNFYGKNLDEVERISLTRAHLGAPDVKFEGDKKDVGDAYALGVWDAASSAVHRAYIAYERSDRVERAKRPGVENGDRKQRSIIDVLLHPKGEVKVEENVGPTTGHNLLFLDAWRGAAVAISSRDDQAEAVTVWIKHRDRWRPIPWRDELASAPPFRGAAAFIEGDQLHVIGGIGEQGDFKRAHFVYDLAKGSRGMPPFAADAWSETTPLSEGVAWPTAISYDKRTYVASGISAFYVREGEVKKRPLPRTKLEVAERNKFEKLSDMPSDSKDGYALRDDRGFVIGPGWHEEEVNGERVRRLTGKIYHYDIVDGGSWHTLPALPRRMGLGQLFREGNTMIYAGGFEEGENGKWKRSNAIFALDLDGLDPTWKQLGESEYVGGKSRLVNAGGRWMSLYLSPEGSRCYHLE